MTAPATAERRTAAAGPAPKANLNDEAAPVLKLVGAADVELEEVVDDAGVVYVDAVDAELAVEPVAVVEAMVVEGVVWAPTAKSPL
jgi:hypothetical protein